MYFTVFRHLAWLAMVGVMNREKVPDVAIDVVVAVLATEETLTGSKEEDALIVATWVAHESAGHKGVVGDHGASNGAMQIGKVWFKLCETNETELRTDLRKNIACGYKVMIALRKDCGSVRGSLRAYSSGSCVGTNTARALVESRCKESGAC